MSALTLADQALRIWNRDQNVYTPEIARTSFLKAEIMLQKGGGQNEVSELFMQAETSWKALTRFKYIRSTSLSEDSFDDLVTFWSK